MLKRKVVTLISMAILTLGSFAFAMSPESVEYEYSQCSTGSSCCTNRTS